MYKIFLIIFFIVCISLISLIIFTPNKNNIIGSPLDINNNIITTKILKDTLNFIIIIFAILFYLISLILNIINQQSQNTSIKNTEISNNYFKK